MRSSPEERAAFLHSSVARHSMRGGSAHGLVIPPAHRIRKTARRAAQLEEFPERPRKVSIMSRLREASASLMAAATAWWSVPFTGVS